MSCADTQYTCVDGGKFCDHKPLFPISGEDIAVTVVLFIGLALASAGGIGGGGLTVPLLMLIARFGPEQAIPLSVAGIFSGSLVRLGIQLPRKHPIVPHRPLIDFQCAMTLLPMSLGGTIIGVIFNQVSPAWLILLTVFVVLAFTAQKTLRKGRDLWKKESLRLRAAPGQELSGKTDEDADRLVSDDEPAVSPEAAVFLEKEKTYTKQFAVIGLFFALLFMLTLFRGKRSGPSVVGVEACSAAYWALTAVSFLFLVGGCAVMGLVAVRQDRAKEAAGYPFVAGDIRWTMPFTAKYALKTMFAGFASGYLGIGGGMLLGPMLLTMGMNPQVSSSTSAFMTLFTSGSSLFQYIILDLLPWGYGIWFFVMNLFSSFVGAFGVLKLVDRYGRTSPIVLSLGTVIALSCVIMTVTGSIKVADQIQREEFMGFTHICG